MVELDDRFSEEAKTLARLAPKASMEAVRAAPCGPYGRTSCGFPPKQSFFGASVPGLKHTLSPRGVCSRIHHTMIL